MNEDFLKNTKLILDIKDDKNDGILSLYVDDSINAIKAYCRIDAVPLELHSLIPQIAARLFRSCSNGVSSITQGDRKIEYNYYIASAVNEYRERLKPFMNKRARVPSQIGEVL